MQLLVEYLAEYFKLDKGYNLNHSDILVLLVLAENQAGLKFNEILEKSNFHLPVTEEYLEFAIFKLHALGMIELEESFFKDFNYGEIIRFKKIN